MSSVHQQGTRNINSFNMLMNHSNTANFIPEIDAERHQVLKRLSPLEPRQRHQHVRTERLKGVGNWVLETNEFRKWSGTRMIVCNGNPGPGKTRLR